jgi:hypothetical protein
MTNMDKVIKELQDTLVVMAEIERRQAAVLREHSEGIVSNEEYVAKLNTQSAEYQRRTDQNLAEITDKLNGLIGYMDGLHPPATQ